MSDPSTNKPAAVQLYALTSGGVRVPLRADASGNLVLAATIDTTNLALHADVDGLETAVASTNTKLDTVNTNLGTIDGRVDGLETAVTSTNTKLDTVNTNLTTIDGRVDGLEALIGTTNTNTAALAQPTLTTAVTPSDSTNTTTTASKGFWVGTGGNVAVKGTGDSAATTLTNVPSGTYIPGAYQRIMSTNTTASNIVSFA
jgi:hypothetical protein